jgi:hypothetical protein
MWVVKHMTLEQRSKYSSETPLLVMLHSCEAEKNFSKLSLQEKFPPIMLEESLTYFLFSMGSISVIGVIQDKTIQQKKKKEEEDGILEVHQTVT